MNAKRYCYRTTHGDLNMHHRTSEKYIRNKILNFLLISFKWFGLVSNCSTSAFAQVDHLCSSIRISLMEKTFSICMIKNCPFNFQQCERIMQLVLYCLCFLPFFYRHKNGNGKKLIHNVLPSVISLVSRQKKNPITNIINGV